MAETLVTDESLTEIEVEAIAVLVDVHAEMHVMDLRSL